MWHKYINFFWTLNLKIIYSYTFYNTIYVYIYLSWHLNMEKNIHIFMTEQASYIYLYNNSKLSY